MVRRAFRSCLTLVLFAAFLSGAGENGPAPNATPHAVVSIVTARALERTGFQEASPWGGRYDLLIDLDAIAATTPYALAAAGRIEWVLESVHDACRRSKLSVH